MTSRGHRDLAVLLVAGALAACGPGEAERSDCDAALVPGDLVITEVFADFKATTGGTGADTGKEWFEIYNARTTAVELAGVTITHSRPDGTKASTHTIGGATIAPGQYFTLGNATQQLVPPYIDYGYAADLGDLFNADGGKLAIACGDRELDSASYGDVQEGRSRELGAAQVPEYLANDGLTSWCQAGDSEFEAGNFGTPGAESDCRPIVVGQCRDGDALRDVVPPDPGDLVITEVMPNPARVADTVGEWFEARVRRDVDLNGVGLDRVGDSGVKPDVITATACVRAPAGSDVVFARSIDPAANGGLDPGSIAGTFRFSLVAGGPTAAGDVAIVVGTTVIDAVRWTRSVTGKSLQLDPDLVDPSANDTESNFCNATAPYGPPTSTPDLGTPGLANTRCALLPPAGMCDAGGTLRAIVTPPAGALVISEVLANPAAAPAGVAATDAQREWFEVANTGRAAFDLNELRVGRVGATGAALRSARCLAVPAGGFAVLARSNDPAVNGMLPRVDATFGFSLVDSHGDVQIAHGDDVLDAARWKSVAAGVTRQLDPSHLTTSDNDDQDATKRQFCAGRDPYGDHTNHGTPGAANAPCP